MSWSEIKKAVNSDIGTPINELEYTNVQDLMLNQQLDAVIPYTTTSLNYYEVLNVSNSKGWIKYVWVNGYIKNVGEIRATVFKGLGVKIVIDDTTLCDTIYQAQNGTSNQYTVTQTISLDSVESTFDGTYSLQNVTNITNQIWKIRKPIRFNNSLKIYIGNIANSSYSEEQAVKQAKVNVTLKYALLE